MGLAAGVGIGMLLAQKPGALVRAKLGNKARTVTSESAETNRDDSRDELGLPATNYAVRL